jgi:UDP-N-acetyl-D-mannosaminuronic acid dehydrogenase
MINNKVVIMGLGYIGLPTAAVIASKNCEVLGVDISPTVVETINNGKIHIVEPDLAGLVKTVIERRNLRASDTPDYANVFVITVPTPFKNNFEPDISYVESALKMIIPFLQENNLLIIESTIPVGTTEKMAEMVYSMRPELKDKLFIAYCPERVLPGNIIYELENNDRVIGGLNEASSIVAYKFYRHFVKSCLHKTNAKTAELCKLIENSFRDVNIAFANELSIICDTANIDVWELIKLANKHPRVNILNPGAGVGGHCIAIDPWFIVYDFPSESKLIRTSREINNYKTQWVIEKIKSTALKYELEKNKKPVIGCLGLTFKPNIDDMRESPAIKVFKSLVSQQFDVIASEPNINGNLGITLMNFEEVIERSDVVVFLVAHKQFLGLHIPDKKICLDFCGIRNVIN